MAEALNTFFTSVFTEENTDTIPEPKKYFHGDTPLENVAFLPDRIIKKIRNLRCNAAPGPDSITPRVLQATADVIARPLSVIFTKSIEEGKVPDDWKAANITPIFKKGSKASVGNYRPVSLTSIVCKLMEAILKDAIVDHLKSNCILNSSQHGFLPGKSCLTNLLDYLDTLTRIVDSGGAADILYLDFAKAFDKVAHVRLAAKLRACGIEGSLKGVLTILMMLLPC